jgi:hypothetical protein
MTEKVLSGFNAIQGALSDDVFCHRPHQITNTLITLSAMLSAI